MLNESGTHELIQIAEEIGDIALSGAAPVSWPKHRRLGDWCWKHHWHSALM